MSELKIGQYLYLTFKTQEEVDDHWGPNYLSINKKYQIVDVIEEVWDEEDEDGNHYTVDETYYYIDSDGGGRWAIFSDSIGCEWAVASADTVCGIIRDYLIHKRELDFKKLRELANV